MVTWSLSMGLCVVLAINNRGTRDVKGVAFPKKFTSRLERWWWTRLCCCCFVILETLYNIMFLWLFVCCAKLLVHNGFMWTNKHWETRPLRLLKGDHYLAPQEALIAELFPPVPTCSYSLRYHSLRTAGGIFLFRMFLERSVQIYCGCLWPLESNFETIQIQF